MDKLSKSFIRPVLGVVAAGSGVAGIARLVTGWSSSTSDYVVLSAVILAMVAACWMFFGLRIWKCLQSFVASLSFGGALRESGLAVEEVHCLGTALRTGGKTGLLPLMVKVLHRVVQHTNQAPEPIGAPAKCADDSLAEGLAKGLVGLFGRENLTDLLAMEKLQLLDCRPATRNEICDAVRDLPVLTWLGIAAGAEFDARRNEFVEAVVKHSLLMADVFRTGRNSTYGLRFEVNDFMFDNVKPEIKIHMLREATERFKNEKFDTVVCIHRGLVNPLLNDFVQELAKYMQATFCPLSTREREAKSDLLVKNIRDFCAGSKSTLLVEPLLLEDGELDKSYDFLVERGATIKGVLILFQENSMVPQRLKNATELQKLTVRNEIKGQIVVDLKPMAV